MNKRLVILGSATLAVGITLAIGFAYYQTANAQTPSSAAVATPDPSLAQPSPAPATSPQPDKKAMLGEVMTAASTYLGVSTADLKTQLQSGKSLADVANATPGKSRDGLVSALSSIGDPKVIARLVDRTITPK